VGNYVREEILRSYLLLVFDEQQEMYAQLRIRLHKYLNVVISHSFCFKSAFVDDTVVLFAPVIQWILLVAKPD
jgi:hypothetical protein